MFVTYFNAGLRVFDISDPLHQPAEIAHWIPGCPPGQAAAQINDVYVSDNLTVYATPSDQRRCLHPASGPGVGGRMRQAAW